MRQFLLAAVTAAALSACSEVRERRLSSIDSTLDQPDLTLPDTVTRRDTSAAVATRPPEPSVEQRTTEPEPAPVKPAKPARRRGRPAARATADTAVQAYAPGRIQDSTPRPTPRAKPDTAASERGTVTSSADTGARATTTTTDTTRDPSRDTLSREVDTTQVAAVQPSPADTARPPADTVRSPADTVTTSPMETAIPPAVATDTATRSRAEVDTAAPAPVTRAARPADTASTPPADTTVASPPAAPAPPARSARELAARTLPVGTEIHAQLDDSITSRRDTVGQIVDAHVMQNVRGPDGRTLIPAGAQVRFSITRIRPSRSKSSQGRLGLRVDSIALNGQLETVKAETKPVPRELRGRGVTAGDAGKVAGGAAAGAVLGRVVGGNTSGAVIGGVAGAAAGAVVATQTKTRDVVVKAKTPVVFVLTAPLVAP
jgi:hypothetical protein